MINETSRDALRQHGEKLETMGDRIVRYVSQAGLGRTRSELAKEMGIKESTMSGRVRDLLNKGRLRELPGKFRCSVTGNQVRCVIAV